ncbi:MAG: ATP-binding protein [Caldisericaceae bacterium]
MNIGFLKAGSVTDGFTVRLDKEVSPETLKIGDFLVIEGRIYKFFGIVDDLKLLSSNEDVFFDPPRSSVEKIAFNGSIYYSEAQLSPYIMADTDGNLFAIKTIPEHFSLVRKAENKDIELVFKQGNKPFFVGTPLTMDEKIYVDLEKLAMRNNAIFGITGSGKTVLAKIVFSGIIKNDVASLLIFDMHNEYGRSSRNEEGAPSQSLKSFFGEKVKVFDVANNQDADDLITIPYKDIDPEDVALVSEILHFSEKSEETAILVRRHKGNDWLEFIFSLQGKSDEEIGKISESIGVNTAALSALIRHTTRLSELDFLTQSDEESSISRILKYLKSGTSVVVQFSGKHKNNPLVYFLVANIITRRIHSEFEKMTDDERKNIRAMIVIEEAHKFLSTSLKERNIFGIIAREMRKFNVTIFVIDQRPSEIDPEVLSQVGTRFVLQLMDEGDVDAVFQGVGGGSRLKRILRSLQPREALLFGFAVQMPVAMKVRVFGKEFIDEITRDKRRKIDPNDALYGGG